MNRTRQSSRAQAAVRGAVLLVVLLATASGALTARAQSAEKRAITFRDLISMHRLSDPQISPDGQWVSYTVATPDFDANHLVKNIWLVPVAGGEPRQLTHGGTDERARWSPDGKKIAYLSSSNGTAQVYTIASEGGTPVKITSLSGGADNEILVA